MTRKTWSDARMVCQSQGATLATVPTHIEQGTHTHTHTLTLLVLTEALI